MHLHETSRVDWLVRGRYGCIYLIELSGSIHAHLNLCLMTDDDLNVELIAKGLLK